MKININIFAIICLFANVKAEILVQRRSVYSVLSFILLCFGTYIGTGVSSAKAAASCPIETVGDSFPNVSYSQNSGSVNWSGNWTEVNESDGASAGIARVRSDLCSSGNCLRLGVPSGNNRQTYSNRGVYREADLSGATSATLTYVYRRGRNSGSQTVVLSVSNDGGNSWTELESYFINSTNTSAVSASFDITDYASSNTQIRFLASGTDAVIGMYIDNLTITYQPSCTPEPLMDYRFDELSWDGTANQVIDSSGNNHNGTAIGGISTIAGKICHAANIPSNTSSSTYEAVDTGVDLDTIIGSSGTISLWYKSNEAWNSGTDKRLFDATDGNKYFFAEIRSDGRVKFWFEDGSDGDYQKTTDTAFTTGAGVWKHLTFVWDVATRTTQIFVDGVEQNISGGNGNTNAFTGYDTLYFGDNRDASYITGQSSADGLIDEALVFDSVLTTTQIQTIFTNQNAGNNYDGSERTCPEAPIEPLIEYRFDELSWNGTSNEVIDSSDNLLHAQSSGGTLSQDAKICRGATFDGVDDHFELPSISTDFSTGFSATAWVDFNTAQHWERVIDFSNGAANNNIIFARNGTSNDLTFEIYNGSTSCGKITASGGIQSGRHHYAVTLSPSRDVVLYRDGVAIQSGTSSCLPANVTRSNNYIGRSAWSHDGFFDNEIDEFKLFSSELSSSGIAEIYTNENAGNNYDGSERTCPVALTPLVEYRFEEESWNGSADEVIDSSGNEHHARLHNNSTPINNTSQNYTPALTGSPGTCGYASQNDGSIQVSGLPLDTTTVGAKTTVTFWMYWDGTNSVMPIGWNYHDIWMYNGYMGFNTWNSDIYGISTAGLANAWHHVVVEFTNGSVTSNRMYIDGVEQTLAARPYHNSRNPRSPNNNRAYVNSQMRVGGVTNSSGYDFHGFLDEFRVYEGALTTAQVAAIMAERHDCNTPVIHHYEISHDGQGLTCDAEPVTIKACTDESCSNLSTESVSLDFLVDGTITSSPTFTGSTVVSFNNTDVETLTLSLNNASVAASNPVVCDDGSGNSCDIVFTNAGFRFLSGAANSTTIPNQVAGASFADTLKLQAVEDTNGVCTGVFSGNTNVNLSQENVNPGGDSGLSFTVNGSDINKHTNVTSVSLSFDGDSIATIPTPVYHDAGEIRLHASYNLGGINLSGSSNAFWVRPAELVITAKSGTIHLNGTSNTAPPTIKAGESFELSVAAYNAATPSVITPNYSPGQIQLKLTRTGPTLPALPGGDSTGGIEGDLTFAIGTTIESSLNATFQDATLSSFSSGTSTYSAANYSEVGLINLDVQDSEYGTSNMLVEATDINIGRFIPHHFDQTVVSHGSFDATCNSGATFAYSGQKDEATNSDGAISYLTNPVIAITAYNKQGAITQNYYQDSEGSINDYMKLSVSDVSINTPTADQAATGVDGNILPLTANMSEGELSQNDLTALPADVALPKGGLHYMLSDDDNFFYNRSANALVAPFTADIDFSISTITDSDGVEVNSTVDASPTGIEIRFGRLVLENSFGPETSDLPQPMQIEHFDGTNFLVSTTNTNCVTYDASKLSLSPNITNTDGGIGMFEAGKTRSIVLKALGAGNQLGTEVTYDIYDWLKYDWEGNGIFVNPSAIATFGVFRGNDRIIYQREILN